jgi:nitroreductase
MSASASFSETVRSRRSVRAFLPTRLSQELINEVLEEAQLAPSNCNTQPWVVHIASGAVRDRISTDLLRAAEEGRYSPDFRWSVEEYEGRFRERRIEQGKAYYECLSIARTDVVARTDATMANYHFFGAPHVAFLFMPSIGDNVRVAADLGMYCQNFLLALTARGLGGVPQTSLGLFADTVRQALGVPSDLKLLFGVSFGHPDPGSPANHLVMPRDPARANVTLHDG